MMNVMGIPRCKASTTEEDGRQLLLALMYKPSPSRCRDTSYVAACAHTLTHNALAASNAIAVKRVPLSCLVQHSIKETIKTHGLIVTEPQLHVSRQVAVHIGGQNMTTTRYQLRFGMLV